MRTTTRRRGAGLLMSPPREAVPDAMEALFAALTGEDHPGVRAVLGHFAFGLIHPYPAGNGRIGRFLMNAMLASGGYPWTVIRVTRRADYLAALEAASTRGALLRSPASLRRRCQWTGLKPRFATSDAVSSVRLDHALLADFP